MTENELIASARELYCNPRTGEWYDSGSAGSEEVPVVRGLVEALEARMAADPTPHSNGQGDPES